jgi:hypothetical protein
MAGIIRSRVCSTHSYPHYEGRFLVYSLSAARLKASNVSQELGEALQSPVKPCEDVFIDIWTT